MAHARVVQCTVLTMFPLRDKKNYKKCYEAAVGNVKWLFPFPVQAKV